MTDTATRKIHIIDDDLHTIQVLKHVLEKKDYIVNASTSGTLAFEAFKTYTPDLVLLDIIMPGMDGYQVCRLLKNDAIMMNVPVVFITSSHDTAELVKGFDAGAVDFISKPVNRAELLARVNTHLELKWSRDVIESKNKELELEIEIRREVEEKFKALSETAFEAVIFIQNGKIIEGNRAAYEIFGMGHSEIDFPSVFSYVDEKGGEQLKNILGAKGGEGPWEIVFFDAARQPFHGLVQYQTLNYKGEVVSVLAIRDITRQKEMDKEIFNAIMKAEEKERKRFSRDMHDGLGALLSTLKIYTGLLQKENKSPQEKELLLQEMKDTLNKAVESARTIANNLMPSVLMDHGLIKALKSFAEALNKTKVINIRFLYPEKEFYVNTNTEIHLYRIVLELINNTLKYAQAENIILSIDIQGEELVLEYKDDGKGFDFQQTYQVQNGNQGLKNILSRVNFVNGEGAIESQPGSGFYFYCKLPL